MIPKVVSSPEFAQDHESGLGRLRSDQGPVILCDFFDAVIIYFRKYFIWELPVMLRTSDAHNFLNKNSLTPYIYCRL